MGVCMMGLGEDLSSEEDVDEQHEGPADADVLNDLGVHADSEEEREDGYPAHVWKHVQLRPGAPGFNKVATSAMRKIGIGVQMAPASANSSNPSLLPWSAALDIQVNNENPACAFLRKTFTLAWKNQTQPCLLSIGRSTNCNFSWSHKALTLAWKNQMRATRLEIFTSPAIR